MEGEREATRFRLVLGAAASVVVLAAWAVRDIPGAAVWSIGSVLTAWLLVSAATLLLIGRGAYRPWMSYLSVLADLVLTGATELALAAARDFNFTGNVFVAAFFAMILLAAVRRGSTLVIQTSLVAGAAHLGITALFLGDGLSAQSVYLTHGGRVLQGVSFVDDLTKAVCMVVAGHVLAYVTRSLRASERHYHDLFESIPDGMVIANARGAVVTVNRRFRAMFGRGEETLTGVPLRDLVDLDAPRGEPSGLRRADGSRLPVRIATAPMRLASGEGIVVSVRDVSEQALLEREVAQSRKMDSIGRLAGGLAHDFNNILGGILGAASLAAHAARGVPGPGGEKLAGKIAMIEEAGRSARDVVRKLLDFTRAPAMDTRRFSLVEVLADVVTLCRKTFGESVPMEVGSAAGDEPWIEGDEGALKQALLSLCLNAGDSMERGGRISLRVEEAPGDAAFCAAHAEAAPGTAYLCAVVEGGGHGAGAEALDRILAPRIADRGEGGPAGGLGTTFSRLMRQHRGFVETAPSPAGGTLVRVYLPRAPAPAPQGGEGAP